MLVPKEQLATALEIAKQAAESHTVGDPRGEGIQLGPVVSETQYNKIQKLIQSGISEGAALVTGGLGRATGSAARLFCPAHRVWAGHDPA